MRFSSMIMRISAMALCLFLVSGCGGPAGVGTTQPASLGALGNSAATIPPGATAASAAPGTRSMDTPTPAPTETAIVSATSPISIEVQSGTTATVITPTETAVVPAGNGFVYVLVHFPALINHNDVHAQIVSATPADAWQLQVKNPPTGDTYALGVQGSGSGSFTIEITQAQQSQPVMFSVQVGNGEPSSAPVATPGSLTVTLADNGQTLALHIGQTFLLNLGEGYDWTVTIGDQTVLSRQVNILTIRGAQGVYQAHRTGITTLTASGNPACRKATPPCAMPSRLFQVQVVVGP